MKAFAFIAAMIACYFLVQAFRQPRPGVFAAVFAWLAYAVYEWLVATAVLCDASCNIRVDLILFWPLLMVVTLFAVYARGEWTPTGKLLRMIGLGFVGLVVAMFGYIALFES